MDNYTDIDVIVTFELDTNSKMKQSKIKNICEAECRSTFQDWSSYLTQHICKP
jgi:hypothetical protein